MGSSGINELTGMLQDAWAGALLRRQRLAKASSEIRWLQWLIEAGKEMHEGCATCDENRANLQAMCRGLYGVCTIVLNGHERGGGHHDDVPWLSKALFEVSAQT